MLLSRRGWRLPCNMVSAWSPPAARSRSTSSSRSSRTDSSTCSTWSRGVARIRLRGLPPYSGKQGTRTLRSEPCRYKHYNEINRLCCHCKIFQAALGRFSSPLPSPSESSSPGCDMLGSLLRASPQPLPMGQITPSPSQMGQITPSPGLLRYFKKVK